jgi:putative CGCGG family rSAM target protein
MTEHGHDEVDPITDAVHENSWSANLETPAHADDVDLVLAHAVQAVERTAAGYHVNLVTHGAHGHPETYLYDELDAALDGDVAYEYVERCGCGGHVTRVSV